MRKIQRKDLLNQAKNFYREARYTPSNYDVLFHYKYFASPVTIRKHFGSWSNYLDEAFDIMVVNYDNKMFYGGYGKDYQTTHPHELYPYIDLDDGQHKHDILGSLTYDNLVPKEAWVTKTRWNDIIDAMNGLGISFGIVPAEKRFLTPYAIVDEKELVIASFDTPHIHNHYKRTTKLVQYFNERDNLLNLNGIKKNHLKTALERIL